MRGCRYPQKNCTALTSVAEHLRKVPGKVIQNGNNKLNHIKTCIEQKQFGHYYEKRGSTNILMTKRGTLSYIIMISGYSMGMPSQRMSKMLEHSRISITRLAESQIFSKNQPDSQFPQVFTNLTL